VSHLILKSGKYAYLLMLELFPSYTTCSTYVSVHDNVHLMLHDGGKAHTCGAFPKYTWQSTHPRPLVLGKPPPTGFTLHQPQWSAKLLFHIKNCSNFCSVIGGVITFPSLFQWHFKNGRPTQVGIPFFNLRGSQF
jgi:hypothetical protein